MSRGGYDWANICSMGVQCRLIFALRMSSVGCSNVTIRMNTWCLGRTCLFNSIQFNIFNSIQFKPFYFNEFNPILFSGVNCYLFQGCPVWISALWPPEWTLDVWEGIVYSIQFNPFQSNPIQFFPELNSFNFNPFQSNSIQFLPPGSVGSSNVTIGVNTWCLWRNCIFNSI
jgi:hypothetical protein